MSYGLSNKTTRGLSLALSPLSTMSYSPSGARRWGGRGCLPLETFLGQYQSVSIGNMFQLGILFMKKLLSSTPLSDNYLSHALLYMVMSSSNMLTKKIASSMQSTYSVYCFSSQFSWCNQVFPEPLPLLSVVFAQGLDSVPLGRCLATVEGQRDGLNVLIELRQVRALL